MTTPTHKPKRQKYNLGSIVAIPLPDGRFAFAKAYDKPEFGIYDLLLDHIPNVALVISKPILFFHAGTDEAIKKGLWPVIGEQPFKDPEDAWTPPKATCYVRATNEWTMGGIPRIQYKGEMHTATLDQVRGLDIMSVDPMVEGFVWTIVDRLVKGNHEEYKVRAS